MTKQKAPFSILNSIYDAYNKGGDKMLIHTGTIGWALSSAAQIFGIMINDKIPKEQKMFLIPQEFADACVNILAFYTITQTLAGFANKLVRTGKFIPEGVKKILVKRGLAERIGKFDFDISKHLVHSRNYRLFKAGVGVLAMTVGSVISCNIITPLLRNKYAAHRQQKNLAKFNDPNPALQNPQTPREMARAAIHHTYMQAFMNRGNLKI